MNTYLRNLMCNDTISLNINDRIIRDKDRVELKELITKIEKHEKELNTPESKVTSLTNPDLDKLLEENEILRTTKSRRVIKVLNRLTY